MNTEKQDLEGKVKIFLKNKSGHILARRSVHNAIVNTGREMVANLFANQQSNKILKVGVGTSGTPISPDQTIDSRSFLAFTEIENQELLVDVQANRARFRFSSTFGATETVEQLREAGVIFSDTDINIPDVLYNGVTFSVIDKREGDVLTLNWEITF